MYARGKKKNFFKLTYGTRTCEMIKDEGQREREYYYLEEIVLGVCRMKDFPCRVVDV